MLRLTALIHTHNDALRLGRCLETVYPCDEIVVVDHQSTDRTAQIAREYGARIIAGESEQPRTKYLDADLEWVLCLDPTESLTEALAASLFEWKLQATGYELSAVAMLVREETPQGWIEHPTAQTRMVPAGWPRWQGNFPATEPCAHVLEGELLHFQFP